MATGALVEELAGVGRHGLAFRETATRTGQHRLERGRAHGLGLDGKPAFAGQISNTAMLAYERQAQLWLMRRRLMDMYRFGVKDAKWADWKAKGLTHVVVLADLAFAYGLWLMAYD